MGRRRKNCNKEFSSSTNKNKSDNTDYEGKLKELQLLNLSEKAFEIVMLAVIVRLRFLNWNKRQILNSINNIDESVELEELTEPPKLTNKLLIIASIILLYVDYENYITQLSLDGEQRDEQLICDSSQNLLASIFVICANLMNYAVLNRPL